MKTVFISHTNSQQDIVAAKLLKDTLELFGHEVLDNWDPSIRLNDFVTSSIQRADVVVVLITEVSPNSFLELGYAIGTGKSVIALCSTRIDLPPMLSGIDFIRWDRSMDDLGSEVAKRIEAASSMLTTISPMQLDTWSKLLTFRTDPVYFERMTGFDFEKSVHEVFTQAGYATIQHDNIIDRCDFIIHNYNGHQQTLVEVKKLPSNTKVSMNHVMEFVDVLREVGAECGIFLSTAQFSNPSIDLAKRSAIEVELWTMQDLVDRLAPQDSKVVGILQPGRIVRILRDRGYGFVENDQGESYFFHATNLGAGLSFDELQLGQQVDFAIKSTRRLARAGAVLVMIPAHVPIEFGIDGREVLQHEH